MVNKLILLLGALLLIGIVSSATDTSSVEDVFKLNDKVNYAKPCWNNGTYCSSASVCNYTIFNPDKTILINNTQAQNKGNNHNVSFYVQQLGMHQVDMFCCDGDFCGSDTMFFQVTGSGQNDNNWLYLIIIIFVGALITLGFYLRDPPFVILGGFGLSLFSLYILLNGISIVQSRELTWGIGIIMLFAGSYLGVRSGWELMGDD